MKHLLFILSCFAFLIITSCGGSDAGSCDINDFNSDVADELAAVDATGMVWALDPTSANCTAWKSAALAYINAVEDFGVCDGLSTAEFDQALLASSAILDAIPCN